MTFGMTARPRRGGTQPGRGVSILPGLVLLAALLGLVLVTESWEQLENRFRPATPESTPYIEVFRAAARRYPEVSAAQLAAHARAESGFQPRARSSRGAEGLMQIIPATFDRFGVDGDGDGTKDPFQPADSVFTAARYLTWLGGQLDADTSDDRVVAAYNAGPNAVRRAGGVPDYPETQTYVARVTAWTDDYRWLDA